MALRLERFAGSDRPRALEAAIGSNSAIVSEIAAAAATLFDRSDAARLGETLGASAETQRAIADSIARLTSDYTSLVRSATDLRDLTSLPPFVIEAASVGLFRAGDLFYSVAAAEPIPDESAEAVSDARASVSELSPLESLLQEVDPDLLVPLQGARASLGSSNPDRVRHVSSSLREVYTHVTHKLAPTKDVRAWSEDPGFYDEEGKPTRRARLLYVVKAVRSEEFLSFVETDVEEALNFLDTFHRGAHKLAPDLSDEQLQKMAERMESLIRTLVEAWRSGRN